MGLLLRQVDLLLPLAAQALQVRNAQDLARNRKAHGVSDTLVEQPGLFNNSNQPIQHPSHTTLYTLESNDSRAAPSFGFVHIPLPDHGESLWHTGNTVGSQRIKSKVYFCALKTHIS